MVQVLQVFAFGVCIVPPLTLNTGQMSEWLRQWPDDSYRETYCNFPTLLPGAQSGLTNRWRSHRQTISAIATRLGGSQRLQLWDYRKPCLVCVCGVLVQGVCLWSIEVFSYPAIARVRENVYKHFYCGLCFQFSCIMSSSGTCGCGGDCSAVIAVVPPSHGLLWCGLEPDQPHLIADWPLMGTTAVGTLPSNHPSQLCWKGGHEKRLACQFCRELLLTYRESNPLPLLSPHWVY